MLSRTQDLFQGVTMSLLLHVKPGAQPPFDHRCARETVIGRSEAADVSIPSDRFISKEHARVFERNGGDWFVEDLDSTNETLLNGQAVAEPTQVFQGDVIRLSNCAIEVALTGSDALGTFRSADDVLRETGSSDLLDTDKDGSLRRYAERLALLNEVHRAVADELSLDKLLTLILDSVFTHIEPEEAVIFLEDAEGRFQRAASCGKPNSKGNYLYSRQLIKMVSKRNMAALVHDVQDDEVLSGAKSLIDLGVRSIVAAPLQYPGGRGGLIALATRAAVKNFTKEDMELLVSLASVAALQMRNLDLHDEALRREKLQKELDLAREIQVGLFPEALPHLAGFELTAFNKPSRTVSGDLYRVQTRKEGRESVLLVADVAGKGMSASLLTASLEALSVGPIESGRSPQDICDRLSRRLYARTPPERFATAFLAVLEPESGRVRFANAGHNPGLVLRAHGEVDELWATGPPLGLIPDSIYTEDELHLDPGDALILYTDGITEATNCDGLEYEMTRLKDICRANAGKSADILAAAIAADLDAFACGTPFEDDRTLVIARRLA